MPATTVIFWSMNVALSKYDQRLTREESPEDELLASRGRTSSVISIYSVTILPLTLLGKHKPVAHTTAPLQHIRILGRVIALTRNIRTAQFEFWRQRSLACPLYIVVVVIRAGISATHHIYIVEAPCIATRTL